MIVESDSHIVSGDNRYYVKVFDGKIFAFGSNIYGELGTGSWDNYVFTPTILEGYNHMQNVKKIACGEGFTLLLQNDGGVLVAGAFLYEETQLRSRIFQPLRFLEKIHVVDVYCGSYCVIFITKDDKILFLGNADCEIVFGEPDVLTDLSEKSNLYGKDLRTISCSGATCKNYFLTKEGKLYVQDEKRLYPKLIAGVIDDVKIVGVSAQLSCHCLLLSEDGKVFGSGMNDCFQLGVSHEEGSKIGIDIDEWIAEEFILLPLFSEQNKIVKKVFATQFCSLVVTADQEVFAFGNNQHGVLTPIVDGHQNDHILPTDVTSIWKKWDFLEVGVTFKSGLFMDKNYQFYSIGNGEDGSLGIGEENKVMIDGYQSVKVINEYVEAQKKVVKRQFSTILLVWKTPHPKNHLGKIPLDCVPLIFDYMLKEWRMIVFFKK